MRRDMETITERARAVGFPRAGYARLGPLPRAEFVAAWLAEGRAGEMRYLERRAAERADPRLGFPWARGIITVAFPYRPPPRPPGDWRLTLRGRIAAYALGTDYHTEILARLDTLAAHLGHDLPGARFLSYVDTGPIVERTWAAEAGLGWIGRHTLVLHRTAGSYFFLGDLLTTLELDPVPLADDHCGTCTRCLGACPTGALTPYAMDPRRCLSYLTIEHRGAIAPPLRPALGNWIFGCDLCQEACPWNADAHDPDTADALCPSLPELLALDASAFERRFAGSPIRRARRAGLLRNVAVALGNSGNPDAVPPLVRALGDPEPLVRGHAAWALGRLGAGAAPRTALERARAAESDPGVAAEIVAALG
ncbi:MAG: tRNA epoxyqueuosine(34) reductase QueG [Candidatus Binatia bacterium]